MGRKKLSAEELQRRHQRMLNTFVREAWDEIPAEIEVKLRSLKAWGFDLLSGLRGGAQSVFVAREEDRRGVGDVYEDQGETFEVQEVWKQLPKGARLLVRVGLEERRGVIRAYYRAAHGEETLLFTLPAAELLLAYFKKRGFGKLLEAFHSSGLTTEFIQKRGEQGKAYDFDQLPSRMRRALREAGDLIRKRTHVGRFTLVYFGKNKDGDDRYIVTWLVPTIHLFDVDIAERIDKLLAALD
ncbi:MAG: TIGR00703 family protein [Chloroflexi bacterium]|nr:TIGR00703 family protein [Chloroflexota bacterium]